MVEIKEVKKYTVVEQILKQLMLLKNTYIINVMSLAKEAIQILIDNKICTKDKLIKFKNDMIYIILKVEKNDNKRRIQSVFSRKLKNRKYVERQKNNTNRVIYYMFI